MTIYVDDPIVSNVAGYAMPRTSWAHVKDGVILGIAKVYSSQKPPFDDVPTATAGQIPLTGEVAVIVTDTRALSGHLIDRHGNTTPAEGRIGALREGMPAYHDGLPTRRSATLEPVMAPQAEEEPEHGETDDSPAQ